MSAASGIEWTDATWNPVRGCARVSEGCRNCYAEIMAARFSDPGQWGHGFAARVPSPHAGEGQGGGKDAAATARWTGKVALIESQLTLPLRWRKPQKIFVNSTSDLFHEALPDAAIDRVFAVMALAPQHTFQVLTKRPERMRAYLNGLGTGAERDRANEFVCHWQMRLSEANPPGTLSITKNDVERRLGRALKISDDQATPNWPLPNVFLGTSVEDPDTFAERTPHLRATPAAIRFLSIEPLLADLGKIDLAGIDWVIVGGESGPRARPFNVAWARSIVRQCRKANVACFVKQLGAFVIDRNDAGFDGCDSAGWPEHIESEDRIDFEPFGYVDEAQGAPARIRLRHCKGGDWSEWPGDLRVREFPRAASAELRSGDPPAGSEAA